MSGSYFHTVFCFVFSSWPSQLSYQSCSLKTLNLIRCATSVYKIYNFWKLHAGGRHQTSPWPLCTCLISLQIKCPQHFLPKLISYGSSAPLGDLQSSFPYDSGYWQLGKGTHLWLMATQSWRSNFGSTGLIFPPFLLTHPRRLCSGHLLLWVSAWVCGAGSHGDASPGPLPPFPQKPTWQPHYP